MLAHWNNSSSVDMSLHSGHIQILSQPGFVLSLSPTHILLSLVWPDWGSKPRLTALDVSFLTIHSLMLVCLSVDKWTEAFIWYKYHTYILRKEIHFYRLTRLLALCFSSPDPKDHARYCHHLSSVVVVRELLHFNLLLWNQRTSQNQFW